MGNNNNKPENMLLSYKSLQAPNSKEEEDNKKETHRTLKFFFLSSIRSFCTV